MPRRSGYGPHCWSASRCAAASRSPGPARRRAGRREPPQARPGRRGDESSRVLAGGSELVVSVVGQHGAGQILSARDAHDAPGLLGQAPCRLRDLVVPHRGPVALVLRQRGEAEQVHRDIVRALVRQEGAVVHPAVLRGQRQNHPAVALERLELVRINRVAEVARDHRRPSSTSRAAIVADIPPPQPAASRNAAVLASRDPAHPDRRLPAMDYGDYQHLAFERRPHGVVLVTINRPEVLNATNDRLHWELTQIWLTLDADADARVAVVTGAGRAFSAGGDLEMVDANSRDPKRLARTMREASDIDYNMINLDKPVISAINGVAVGAGLVVALLSDISIISETARFTDGHTRLGVVAGDHAAIVWPLLCGMAKAK